MVTKENCVHDWKVIDTQIPHGSGPIFQLLCRRCGQRRDAKGLDEVYEVQGRKPTKVVPK